MALKQRHKTRWNDHKRNKDGLNSIRGMAYSNLVPRALSFLLASKPRKSALGTRLGLLLKTPETTISKIQGRDTRPPPPLLRGSQILPSTARPFSPNLSLHWIRFKYGLISLISTNSFKRRLPAEVPRTYNWRGKVRCHPRLRFFWVFLLGNKH